MKRKYNENIGSDELPSATGTGSPSPGSGGSLSVGLWLRNTAVQVNGLSQLGTAAEGTLEEVTWVSRRVRNGASSLHPSPQRLRRACE